MSVTDPDPDEPNPSFRPRSRSTANGASTRGWTTPTPTSRGGRGHAVDRRDRGRAARRAGPRRRVGERADRRPSASVRHAVVERAHPLRRAAPAPAPRRMSEHRPARQRPVSVASRPEGDAHHVGARRAYLRLGRFRGDALGGSRTRRVNTANSVASETLRHLHPATLGV